MRNSNGQSINLNRQALALDLEEVVQPQSIETGVFDGGETIESPRSESADNNE